MAKHLIHLIAKHLHSGGGVEDVDGKLRLTRQPGESASDGKHYPEYTGDVEFDTMERRVALGLPPVDLSEYGIADG